MIATILVSELSELAQAKPPLAVKLLQSCAAQSSRSVIRTKSLKQGQEPCVERVLKFPKVPNVRCGKQWGEFFLYVEHETGWKPQDITSDGVAQRDAFTSRVQVRTKAFSLPPSRAQHRPLFTPLPRRLRRCGRLTRATF